MNGLIGSSSAAWQGLQVSETLFSQINLPDLRTLMPGNNAPTALIAMVLFLALIFCIYRVTLQHRRQKRRNSSNVAIVTVEQNISGGWDDASAHKPIGNALAYDSFAHVARRSLPGRNLPMHNTPGHTSFDQEDDDTSELPHVNDFDFDDLDLDALSVNASGVNAFDVDPFGVDNDVTYLLMPKVEQQVVGHLVRVTSEPRFPAELALYGLDPMLKSECQITIGRHSKHNTLVISDKSVSREHAVIVQRGEGFFIHDKASTAGTLLNWKRIKSGDDLPLRHKDILSIGEATYEFRLQEEEIHSFL